MISKEDFRKMEREYNTWLYKHPKGDHNYKSFSHMRRSIEFAKYYNDKQIKKIITPLVVSESEQLCDHDFKPNGKGAEICTKCKLPYSINC